MRSYLVGLGRDEDAEGAETTKGRNQHVEQKLHSEQDREANLGWEVVVCGIADQIWRQQWLGRFRMVRRYCAMSNLKGVEGFLVQRVLFRHHLCIDDCAHKV